MHNGHGAAGAEFWIDVGGTFTDSFYRSPDGTLTHYKVLSSGVIKGAIADGSTCEAIVDDNRAGDPAGIWAGFQFRLLNERGRPVFETSVAGFSGDPPALRLAEPLPGDPQVGQRYELSADVEAPIVAIRYLLACPLEEDIPPVAVRLGTTRGTNALITRRGARAALVTTQGFGDILHIGYQNRPRIFELAIRKRRPLFAAVVEIDERIDAAGNILVEPDMGRVRSQLQAVRAAGIESLAICLLNAFVRGEHELLVAEMAREVGFAEISVSSRIAPLVKIVSRGDTTVMDAYLNPVLRRYVESLRAHLSGGSLRLLTSAGGLVDADVFVGKDSILSGPAGGVVGFSRVARAAGYEQAIGFDMGGTSTDVSRFDGRWELEFETEKSEVRVVAPMMAIETVAAGGGSICHFDGVKLVVGPDSAGADPGPACYGRGGPLTVTDVNFLLGKIPPERFPFPLDRAAAESRLQELAAAIGEASAHRYALLELAEGFVRVANANMAKAIGSISVAKGCDPRDYLLVPFGGAAGQHACAVATELGMRRILHHPAAGLLSAYGIGLADVERHRVAGVYKTLSPELLAELEQVFSELETQAAAGVADEGIARDRIAGERFLELRYRGVEASLSLPSPEGSTAQSLLDAFEAEHHKLYGYVHQGRPLEIVAARVEARGQSSPPLEPSTGRPLRDATSERTTRTYFGGQTVEAQLFDRAALQPGDRIRGPAIVCETASTAVIDPHWEAEVLSGGELLVRPSGAEAPAADVSTAADPVMLEIFNNQFAAIAEQMGITLRNTSSSVNVKERLDFSCALFTPAGDLVVNAPHIPVHLGAMAETVRRTIADNPALARGDVFVTNDPYRGGSHLPDVTVITPVHDAHGKLLFFTASRAHHAELGGITPGSMPPFSKNLAEEGVLIRNFKLIDAGRERWSELRTLLTTGPYPTRSVEANLADISAQVAANQRGARDLVRLVERYSLDVVEAYMGHIQRAAEQKVRQALARLPSGTYPFADHLDDGTPIAVTITIAGETATVDFTGTGDVVAGNLNANRAITTAAVMYVLRAMLAERHSAQPGRARAGRDCHSNGTAEPDRARPGGGLPGGRGRQRGNFAARGRRAVGSLGPGRRQPGNDEQPAVRRHHVRLLRNHLRWSRSHARARRRRRRTHAHDQHAAHRSGSAGEALSGPRPFVRHPARLGRWGAHPRWRRRRAQAGVSASRWKCRSSRSAADRIRRTDWPADSPARWAATRSSASTARSTCSRRRPNFESARGTCSRSKPPAAAATARRERDRRVSVRRRVRNRGRGWRRWRSGAGRRPSSCRPEAAGARRP